MKRVVIDATPLLRVGTGLSESGISRTTRELIQSLGELELPFEVHLYGQRLRGPRVAVNGVRFPVHQLRAPRWQWIDKIKNHAPIVESICRHDLFHATGNFAALCYPQRCIATLHDAMFFSYPEEFLGHSNEAKRIPHFVRRCRALITCSEASKRDIVHFMGIDPQTIHVLPWGLRHEVFYREEPNEKLRAAIQKKWSIARPYFLQVSCDIGRKNSPLLFDVYRQLLRQDPANDLVLIWRNPPDEILRIRANEGLEDRIHILSFVSDDELRMLYSGATAMAFPSAYEGFGLPVLEAMACGAPVITTRGGSLPEVAGDGAVYVAANHREELYQALERFENNEFDNEAMRARGLAHSAKFTWNTYTQNVVRLYQQYLQ